MSEEWRPVVGWEGLYEVSNLGRVRGVDRRVPAPAQGSTRFVRGCVLRQVGTRSDGYMQVGLRRGGKLGSSYLVHRLVLEAFVGARPDGMECRHLNGVATDNRLVNLAWGTPLENARDRVRHGTQVRGEAQGSAKLTADDVLAIRAARATGESIRSLAARYGVQLMTISLAASGKSWRHL